MRGAYLRLCNYRSGADFKPLVKYSANSRTEFTFVLWPSPRTTLGSSTSTGLDLKSPLPSTFTSTPAPSFDS